MPRSIPSHVGVPRVIHPNPVYNGYFADPFVWRCNGVYYAVGTGPASASESGAKHFPLLRSTDLLHWDSLGHALLPIDPEAGGAFWAPEVAMRDGVFYLYYSVGHGDKRHHLRVAASDTPEGPYKDMGIALTNPEDCPFAIDAHPFRDDDGTWYLFYSRDFLDTDSGFRAGTGIVMDRLEGMTQLAGDERMVVRATRDWQRFAADRPIYGGVYDWHTIEGASVLKRGGLYYCFYSGGCWQNESYGVDYVVADSVAGPYRESGESKQPRVLRTTPGVLDGPGHNSFVPAPDGDGHFIVYHAWNPGRTARQMHIGRLHWTRSGPALQGLAQCSADNPET